MYLRNIFKIFFSKFHIANEILTESEALQYGGALRGRGLNSPTYSGILNLMDINDFLLKPSFIEE